MSKFKICEQLFLMNARQLFNGFKFDYDLVLDKQVRPVTFIKFTAFKTDRDRHLPPNTKPLS